jgi:2-oxoglutarate dehydrogenase E2 component (dihydrolipoamide succinyltransferase)
MPAKVIMPQMGESIFEGTLTKWLKKPGDKVQRDEPLFEISTDKVDAEIPSPASGVLSQVLVNEGQTVQINTVVAEIAGEGEAAGPGEGMRPAGPPPAAVFEPQPQAVAKTPPLPGAEGPPARAVVEFPSRAESDLALRGEARSSPLVRKLAEQHGVDLSRVKGTGLGSRITKNDIVAYIQQQGGQVEQPAPVSSAPWPPPPPPAAVTQQPARQVVQVSPPAERQAGMPAPPQPGGRVEAVPMTIMRQKIAEHMVAARRTAAHVNSVFQVDLTRIVKLREAHKAEFEQRNGVKLTFMPFISRAAISALKAFPYVNADVDGNTILLKKDINLGIAVALENGLIVPVIKNADEKSFLGLARAIRDVADRARRKRLSPDEVHGATFTITNPGQYGAMFGLPIIPLHTLAILGVGAIQKAPVVLGDAIAIRSIVHLSLSYDHRVVDGAIADQFMAHAKKTLENWEEPIL